MAPSKPISGSWPYETVSIVVIVATVFAMALTDALIKLISADMSLWQIYVLRSLAVLPIFTVSLRGKVRPRNAWWTYIRAILLSAMYVAIYAAIPVLSLSVLAAALYTGPLFITAISALLLKRSISTMNWGAILLGLLGVILVLRPAPGEFDWYGLIPLLAALLYAIAAVLTSTKCLDESPMVMAFALNATLLIFGTIVSLVILWVSTDQLPDYPFLFGGWSTMTSVNWLTTGVMSFLFVCVSVGLARAYQSKMPEVIAAFDYSYLLFAVALGIILFDDWPNALTCVGLCLILLAGLLSAYASRHMAVAG